MCVLPPFTVLGPWAPRHCRGSRWLDTTLRTSIACDFERLVKVRDLHMCSVTVTIRPGFPGHAFVPASGRVFENRRFVRVFGPIRKYIRTLPIAKAYDGMRQRKLVSFQYKMSVTSQNSILVQASCTCLLNRSKRCAHH